MDLPDCLPHGIATAKTGCPAYARPFNGKSFRRERVGPRRRGGHQRKYLAMRCGAGQSDGDDCKIILSGRPTTAVARYSTVTIGLEWILLAAGLAIAWLIITNIIHAISTDTYEGVLA